VPLVFTLRAAVLTWQGCHVPAQAKPRTTSRKRKRRPADPGKAWARRLARTRPGLVEFILDGLGSRYGHPIWRRVHDPTSELVLTILSQNTADVNAEHAFELLRARFPGHPGPAAGHPTESDVKVTRPGWGGSGLEDRMPPDWDAVEQASLEALIDAIRPGGLGPQKAPRIQASLRAVREARGNHSLEFLGELTALEARGWLAAIPGIGRKTASVVLLFSFGTPLMPVDRHVERVATRIGLLPPKVTADAAHEHFLALLEPDQMYEAHVNLITHGRQICHARQPACGICPIAPRCRYYDHRAP
jgi:endonuclease-3